VPALVAIQVTNVPDVPSTRVGITLGTNSLQLVLRGEPFQRYAIEVSENLVVWTQVTLLRLSPTGTATFASPLTAAPRQFYRARVAP
jgi:hypothetical protein